MIHSDPVNIQYFQDSYNITPGLSSSGFYLFTNLSGIHRVRINNVIYESSRNFFIIIPSSIALSISGSGKSVLLYCGQNILKEITGISIGRKLMNVLPSITKTDYKSFYLDSGVAIRIDKLIWNISLETNLGRTDSGDMIQIHLYEILLLLKRAGSLSKVDLEKWASKQIIWNISDIIHFIEDNFDSSFSLDELANRCALNSSYFSRSFKEYAGVPLFEYINRLRINRASLLLKSSDMTILDIAFSVGYNNVSFFNRYFKKLKMMSPGEYRRKVRS